MSLPAPGYYRVQTSLEREAKNKLEKALHIQQVVLDVADRT